MLAIRLEWTVKEFFQADGIGKFTDRMAAVLGIHKADLKVVQVYEGSVIIEFQVMSEEGDEDPQKTLKEIEKKFEETAPTLGDSLGAPVMQVVTSEGNIFAMPGYEDISGLQNNNQFADLISQFEKAQAEKAKKEESIWDGMTEVVDEDNSDNSDENKSNSGDSQDGNDETNQTEKEKSRSQVVKTQIVTEIVTKEQSADDVTTQSILIVVVAALCLIIIAMVVVCIMKRKRQTGPLVVAVPRDSIRGANNSPDNTSFEDNQKPQYNPKDNLDILNYNTSSKKKNSSRPSSQQS